MSPRAIRRAAERVAAKQSNNQSSNISEAQLAANRANAQLSTGAVTPEGKAKVKLNALSTALTGQTVLLPTDDAEAYLSFVGRFEIQYDPQGIEEETLVQSIADTNWRILRIPALEAAIYAKGYIECADLHADRPAPERQALIEAEILLKYERQLRNLHTQESRLRRSREKDQAELTRLQSERRRKEMHELAQQRRRQMASQSEAGKTEVSAENGFEFAEPQSAATAPAEPEQAIAENLRRIA